MFFFFIVRLFLFPLENFTLAQHHLVKLALFIFGVVDAKLKKKQGL